MEMRDYDAWEMLFKPIVDVLNRLADAIGGQEFDEVYTGKQKVQKKAKGEEK